MLGAFLAIAFLTVDLTCVQTTTDVTNPGKSFSPYSPYEGCQTYQSNENKPSDFFRISGACNSDEEFSITFAVLGTTTAVIQLTVSPYALTGSNNYRAAYTVSKYIYLLINLSSLYNSV